MPSEDPRPILIDGEWRPASTRDRFRAVNPRTKEPTGPLYPVSSRKDLERALEAGDQAAGELAAISGDKIAAFLEAFAGRIQAGQDKLVETAHEETALSKTQRLAEIEIPRTISQLRQAASAARDGSWTMPTIDTRTGIRSMHGPLGGPVAVFGPNNFPFAFNSIAGGDFVAAIAAGNPVIAKANPGHPRTTELLAEKVSEATRETGLPPGTAQLIYHMNPEDGEWFVSHPLIGATAFTGSRGAGLALKRAADRSGKLFYMETGSVNPVLILPGAIEERANETAADLVSSCLLASGQFCTKPGVVVLPAGNRTEEFIADVVARFDEAPTGTLLAKAVEDNLALAVEALKKAGAKRVTGAMLGGGEGFSYNNTVLRVEARRFLKRSSDLQREAFGNATLFVVTDDEDELLHVVEAFEGSLTGSIYSGPSEDDDALYDRVAPVLRRKVGRLINDKMPTGVAVSAAMSHGGPYPATSHPGFTAVGIPPAMLRFTALHCYDNVRRHRLPIELSDKNPTGRLWRRIDGAWTTDDVPLNA